MSILNSSSSWPWRQIDAARTYRNTSVGGAWQRTDGCGGFTDVHGFAWRLIYTYRAINHLGG